MSPTRSRAVLCLLISILLAGCIANAAALPHQVLELRATAAFSVEVENVDRGLQAAADVAVDDKKKNFFEKIAATLRGYNGWQILRGFWARLFDGRDGELDDVDVAAMTALFVTATLGQATSVAVGITPTSVAVSLSDLAVVAMSSDSEELAFSILPIFPTVTAIDNILTSPIPLVDASFTPLFPEDVISVDSSLPTAVIITDEFSVTIPTELLTEPVILPTVAHVLQQILPQGQTLLRQLERV
ncbi:hypothetical protein GQ44DRAFT_48433 [Phaeosphaeriaceae sp. PMI808]|nr:hypothetical protein GQ44DRAFT_48433 [Phaeosphaeriaceae sp. PMI808]